MARPRLHPQPKPGDVYVRLEVIREADPHVLPNGQSYPVWWCRCECGKEKPVREGHLIQGRTLRHYVATSPKIVGANVERWR